MDWNSAGMFGMYTVAGLLCLIGFLLSCLSISGTWLVLAATGLLTWLRWPAFPGLLTLLSFLVLCIAVEVAEALAGSWGVQRRGGSKAAGWAALGGGLIGLLLGGLIPIPVLGPLLGMMAGSFACSFCVEHRRLKKASQAAHIATGTVLARLAVIFLKITVTLMMILVLGIGSLPG